MPTFTTQDFTYSKMFKWPIFVYYEDTDAGGVVYHSNYLKFFERARTQWLTALGINQTALLQQDIAFVVKHADINFRRAAKFEQNLIVESKVIELKKASLVFYQGLLDEQGNCYCEGKISIACISLSRMRPIAIPQHIVQEFKRAR
jgi:acyl-CoA thioester hydrolase